MYIIYYVINNTFRCPKLAERDRWDSWDRWDTLGHVGHLGRLGYMGHVGHLGRLGYMGQLEHLGQLKIKTMNIKQIKEKYTCLDYIGPDKMVRKTAYGFLCRCPWREDKNPSLSITPNGKGWQDHATGEHGNLIDLVAKCIGSTDFARICAEFERIQPNSFSLDTAKNNDDESKEKGVFALFEVVPLRAKGLYAYLHQRGIDTAIAQSLCQEAHYSFQVDNEKYLYALAFRNDRGGYELRSPYIKGSKSPKAITSHLEIENASIVVFEGFMDALSFFTLSKGIKHNYLILNSVVNVDSAIAKLREWPDAVVYLLLDNDPAGDEAAKKMLSALPNAKDIRYKIAPHKDVNDYLRSLQGV